MMIETSKLKNHPFLDNYWNNITFPGIFDTTNFIDNGDNSTNQFWPEIPLAQLIQALTNEKEINTIARLIIPLIVESALHSSNLITFCSLHQSTIMFHHGPQVHKKCIDPDFPMFLYPEFSLWYIPGECPYKYPCPAGFMYCPWCKKKIDVNDSCSFNIRCFCRKVFCRLCGGGPWISNHDFYVHYHEVHNE